jgi:hypothetical protein
MGEASLSTDYDRQEWKGIADFAPLAAVAVSPQVIAALRKPSTCPSPVAADDHFRIGIDTWVTVEANIAVCPNPAFNELRDAVTTFFDRLSRTSNRGTDGGMDLAVDGR